MNCCHTAKLVLPCVLLSARIFAGETKPDYAKLAPLPPCPQLAAAAQARRIPLDVLDPPGEPGRLNPGDSFTGLVTLCEPGGRRTQWLLYFTALPACPKVLATQTPKPMALYSGLGNRLEYASAPAVVRLRTLGPFAAGDAPRGRPKCADQSVTFTLDKGFLGLGLAQAAATLARAEAMDLSEAAFWFASTPPNPAQVAKAQQVAEALQLTPEEERTLGGAIPAMLSYGEVIEHVEVLQEIMQKVSRKPSVWSVVGHLGVTINLRPDTKHFSPADPRTVDWPASTPAYHFPMVLELNRQLALTVTFLVTNPRPPLLACGGILGMLAERPGDKETYLTMRIISAQCKPAPNPNQMRSSRREEALNSTKGS